MPQFRPAIAALAIVAVCASLPAAAALDLSKPEDNLTALVKMRCSMDPAEHVVTWWKGTIFAQFPAKAPSAILGFEGYNICRMEPTEDGSWRFISRELSFYRDLKTGALIDSWDNPFTNTSNAVVQVANDPVNHVFSSKRRDGGPNIYPWIGAGSDLMMTFNVPLTYPNPLSPAQFPEESSGEMYVGSEHFMFFTPRASIDDAEVRNAPASYGWTRIGPWVPWMKMGTREGNLLYIAQGHKIAGVDELPDDMQALIKAKYPEYARAPDAWTQPNETSWTYYKKLQEKEKAAADSDAKAGS
jgi:hypothetical protein